MKQPLLLKFLFWVVLVAAVQPGRAQSVRPPCVDATGLQAWLPLDETGGAQANDASGAGHAGRVTGGVWQQAAGPHSLLLTNDDNVFVPLTCQPTAFTVAFWTDPAQLTDWNDYVGAKVASGNVWGGFAFHAAANGTVYTGIDAGDANHWLVTPPGLMQAQQWQHYVFTFADGTGTLYRNGQLVASRGGMPAPLAWQGLLVGGTSLYNRCPFQGSIADLRLYTRPLSAAEANALYQCAPPVSTGPPPCTAGAVQVSSDVTLTAGRAAPLQAQTPTAALSFDGVDDQVTVAIPGTATAALLPNVVNTFTMEAWVNPTAPHEIDRQQTGGVDGISNQRYLIFPTYGGAWGDGHAGMGISVGTNGISVYELAASYMPPILVWPGAVTGWTHLAVVYQNGRPSLYVNGQWVAQGEQSPQAYVHPSLGFGGDIYGYFQGQADEIRIWNEARTAAQIQAQYRRAATASSALVGCWHLDDKTGTTAADASGHRLTGTLTRGGRWSGHWWGSPDDVLAPTSPTGPQWQAPSAAPLVPALTYAWSPATGLDRTDGPVVVARPTATTTYTVTATGAAGCTPSQTAVTVTVLGSVPLPPDVPADNRERNWTLERSFDGTGNVIAESKQFTDALGRPTQAQARNAATQQVFAAQTVYSTGGQPVLQTLAAPINNQSFNYQENFVTAGGQPYGPANFEDGKASQPDAVDAGPIGTLGHYFSQLNEEEPLTPITGYPYSLVESYEGPLGGTKRAAGPGDALRMGTGRESKGRDFPLRQEFDHYAQLRPLFVPGSPLATLEYQGMKSVSVNADGRESIVVTNKEGQALVSCLSGAQYPAVPVAGYLSTDPANPSDPNAPVYQDVHIPAAGPQEVTFTAAPGQPGSSVRVVDLLTDAAQDYPVASPDTRVTLAPGFYRFVALGGTLRFSYPAHYGNFSYTYYDDAGRVVATVAPNGVDLNSTAAPQFVTRNTYDTSGRLLATESIDEGRAEYVYARDGRIRFSQSALQRPAGRFSYSNYDEVGRVVESGEYTPSPAALATVCGSQREGQELVLTAPVGETFTGIQAATYGAGNGPSCESLRFEPGCSADVTAPVRAALASQLAVSGGATTLRLTVANAVLGDPCGGTAKTLQIVATRTGQTPPLPPPAPAPTPAPLPPPGQRIVCGLQPEGLRYLVLTAPAGAVFKGIQSATYGLGSGSDCASFTFRCSNDVTAQVRALVATQLSNDPTELQIPANNGALGDIPCGPYAKVLRVVAVYDAGSPVVESTVFENYLTAAPSAASTLQPDLLESRARTGKLNTARCAQRNQVWYDLPWDGAPGNPAQDAQLGSRTQEFVLGAVAKTRNDQATTWYSYDELGRVTWVVQDLVGVGVKTLDYTYDFSGNVLEVAYQKDQPDGFHHYYAYDAAQRLTAVYTSPDGTARTLQAQYSYYLHGPLKRVELANGLQGVDYTYTLQGWLKSINDVNQSLDPGQDTPTGADGKPKAGGIPKDLFGLTLDYFSGDYLSRARPVVTAPDIAGMPAVPTRYDGTIRLAAWRTAADVNAHRQVAYEYDEKSQLKQSTFGQLALPGLTDPARFTPNAAGALQEGGLRYDANGNLQTLQRTNELGAVTDNFSYSYKANTNQLAAVHTGNENGPAVLDYDYDALGQMTRQKDEQGQRYLTYDVTGKTTGVYLDDQHTQPLVTFAYDDRGFRVRKTSYPMAGSAAPARSTYYVRDVAGNILAVYDQAAPNGPVQRSEVPLYGAGRLGTLTRLDDGTEDYRYELNDHLGNARVVFHRPTTVRYAASMETDRASQEEQDFTNVVNTRFTGPVSHSPSKVSLLGMYSGQPTGPGKVLTVQKGDTITFSAYAWLTAAAKAGTGQPRPNGFTFAPILLSGAGNAARGENSGSGNPLIGVGVGAALALGGGGSFPGQLNALDGTTSNVYLRYRVLDENGQEITSAGGAQEADGARLADWQQLQVGLRLQQAGTVELSVEVDGLGPDVFVDDVTVEQTGGMIVQEQHQYAFGAPLPGLSYTVGNKRYRYGYQGQYAEHDAETGWENFDLRLYNSRVGRWMSYDPEGQFSSPYVGMGNNPVSGVDPNGGFCEGCLSVVIPVSEGAVVTASKAASTFARIGAVWGAFNGMLNGATQHVLGVAGQAVSFTWGLSPFTAPHSWKALGNQASGIYNFSANLLALDHDILSNNGRGNVTRNAMQTGLGAAIHFGDAANRFLDASSSMTWEQRGGSMAELALIIPTEGLGEAAEAERLLTRFSESTASDMLAAGAEADLKQPLYTKAGRSLQKHSDRPGSLYPKIKGREAAVNIQGQSLLKSMVYDNNAVLGPARHHAIHGMIRDLTLPNGTGARFSEDLKTLIHFK